TDADARARLTAIADGSGGCIEIEPIRPSEIAALAGEPPSYPPLQVRGFDRTLDLRWARLSYSRLTAAAYEAAHDGRATSEPETPGVVDEPSVAVDDATVDEAAIDEMASRDDPDWPASPMADLP